MVAKSSTWPFKKMPTWLYHQNFAMFSLNHHYNEDAFLRGYEAWDTKDVIIDGKLLDVEVVGSGTEGLVTMDEGVNIEHAEEESVWLDEYNAIESRRLLDMKGALVNKGISDDVVTATVDVYGKSCA
ncbi:hypothetical protein TNCV_1440881 [Trichonephila clavipes]|nr:hypothetical protein TNCV_1440881 [Trichonephila clavipes]